MTNNNKFMQLYPLIPEEMSSPFILNKPNSLIIHICIYIQTI